MGRAFRIGTNSTAMPVSDNKATANQPFYSLLLVTVEVSIMSSGCGKKNRFCAVLNSYNE